MFTLLNVPVFLTLYASLVAQVQCAPLGSTQLESKRAGDTKYVFMHHIVGTNRYNYTEEDWKDDISQIAANGIDAIALNIGADSWQQTQVNSAYSAAESVNSSIKLFVSYDFTSFPCDPSSVVSFQSQLSSHSSQFKVDGKPMISSYEGSCLGVQGWEQVKSQTGGYTMPFISGLEGQFGGWGESAMDTWYCWGCAWPQNGGNVTNDGDKYYIEQLGSRFATTVSNWMFTHYDYKNFYQRGDDWLLNSRWEGLMEIRDKLTFVEMVTWNDYGESDYFGPVKGTKPASTTWAPTSYDHTPFFSMSAYYIEAFKTGSYPSITEDTIYYWARPHPASATASADSLAPPTGHELSEDYLWAVVFAKEDGKATVGIGSEDNIAVVDVKGGEVTKVKVPLKAGKVKVVLERAGKNVIEKVDDAFEFKDTTDLYNFNVYASSASSDE